MKPRWIALGLLAAVIASRRNLGPEALYYQSNAGQDIRSDAPLQTVGGFSFYARGSAIT